MIDSSCFIESGVTGPTRRFLLENIYKMYIAVGCNNIIYGTISCCTACQMHINCPKIGADDQTCIVLICSIFTYNVHKMHPLSVDWHLYTPNYQRSIRLSQMRKLICGCKSVSTNPIRFVMRVQFNTWLCLYCNKELRSSLVKSFPYKTMRK